jgi:hypothetical protein
MAAVLTASTSGADEPEPPASVDQFLRRVWTEHDIAPAQRCGDREFVRRAYLDLAGRIPAVDEVNAFLSDAREAKRQHLVDQLIDSEDFIQHFADLLDALLMGRASEPEYAERAKHGWRAYLESALRDDRPWNDLAREILLARPDGDSKHGSIWFLYERDNSHQEIAEAIAPAFFGIRVECAQCHDHMLADEILQADYWGLVAFFNRGENKQTKGGPRVIESAIGGFSEFANLSGDSTPNRLTFLGTDAEEEARPEQGEKQEDADDLYATAAVEGEPRVPVFSRRGRFVDDIVDGHPLLARAMVNRLWAMLLRRGIVHPYDEMDSVHPPSHPELLDWLADDFAAHGFQIKHILRQIAVSEAYQLSSIRPEGVDDPSSFAWYLERPLTAEQMGRSIQLALRGAFNKKDPIVGSFRQKFLEVLPDENVVTIGDALFLSNNRELDAFISDSWQPDHLLSKLNETQQQDRAELLFQTILSRPPSDDESAAIEAYFEGRGDTRQSALEHVAWALLTSAEFRFNH